MTVAPPRGLTSDEAARLAREGHANVPVRGSSRTTARILRTTVFSFYNNTLFVIGAALLALGRYSDALVSVGLGIINAALAAFQELRARRALDRLQLLAREPVTVLRDDTEVSIAPSEVVAGDLLRVRTGDQIVVDGPIVGAGEDAGPLEVDESLLTGETDPVPKTDGDLLLSGSAVASGQGWQRAEAVGAASHAGQLTIAARTDTTEQTPLQWRIALVVRLVILLVVLMSGAILAQALLEGSTVLRFVQTSAVLSGLVPYGLFFLIAVAYAVGAARIAGRGALIQQTNAVEAISRVDVVCTDKTGTLTSGALALVEVVALHDEHDEHSAHELLGTLVRSTSAPNATTRALRDDAAALPGTSAPVDEEVEFRSALRWSGVTVPATAPGPAAGRALVLGAPATLVARLDEPREVVELVERETRARAERGLRVLLLATATGSLRDAHDRPRLPALRAEALVVLGDELRPGVSDTLAQLAGEGVTVKVISGDDPVTVAALARRAGLPATGRPAPAISGPELARRSGADFDDAVDEHTVFGRVAPEQKEQIVEALRRRGRQVAMVGDGVNDARALKRAHVGVAMRSGSSVTRDVADIVLTDDSFTTLGPARREGRRILAGVGSSMYLFLARVATQMLVILTVTLLGLGFPYTPTQVGLTLFTVGLPTLFLTMWARPGPPAEDLLVSLARFVLPVGILTAGFATAVYAYLYQLVTSGLTMGDNPNGAALFEHYTGLSASDPTFVTASATLGAQSGLSVFVSTTAIVLILLLEPPARLFTAWRPVTDDRRPLWLAVGLFVVFTVVLALPATQAYFGLTAPDPPVLQASAVALVAWFVTLSLALRFQLLERLLGLRPGRKSTVGAPDRELPT